MSGGGAGLRQSGGRTATAADTPRGACLARPPVSAAVPRVASLASPAHGPWRLVRRPSASSVRSRMLPEWLWPNASGFDIKTATRDDASARWPYRRAISEVGHEAVPAHPARCLRVLHSIRPAGSGADETGASLPTGSAQPSQRAFFPPQHATRLLFPSARSRGPAIMKSPCLAMPEADPLPSGVPQPRPPRAGSSPGAGHLARGGARPSSFSPNRIFRSGL